MEDNTSEHLIRFTGQTYPPGPQKFSEDLLEQYKIACVAADNVSTRRENSNRYLITLNTAIVALYGFQAAGAANPYLFGGLGKGLESADRASWRVRVDLALLATLRDGLLRRSEAAALIWGDVESRGDGATLITLRQSKTDQEAEGLVLYIGREAAQALQAIRPAPDLLDLDTSVFGMTTRNIGKRVTAAAKAAGLREGFTGHSGRVGMAQDPVKSGVELPALMTAGRWKSSTMPARYTERQAADRGAVARYYQQETK